MLTVTELLRKAKVVGKFVEFFGEGVENLAVPDRATIGNMAPEYGATMGFFPVDDKTIEFFRGTGRTDEEIAAFEAYFRAQGLFGIAKKGEIDFSQEVELDLGTVAPSLAGPKRPQDRIELGNVKSNFTELFSKPMNDNGFAKKSEDLGRSYRTTDGMELHNGDVLIAAITSCTNTSNPGVLLAAGLLAKKAVERGLTVKPHIKTSLAPGSRVVTDYLQKAGLLPYLEKLGFYLAGYGCTTCIGNAGDLRPTINEAITANDLVCAAVLSGNRNFEARIHPNLRANFLASPPLVVAYAIAGTMMRDLMTEPLGKGKNGEDVWIGDIWPTGQEIHDCMKYAMDPKTFRRLYGNLTKDHPLWNAVPAPAGQVYDWPKSTYIAEPPFFADFDMLPGKTGNINGARALGVFGDSVTTDHISPAGSIKPTSPAGIYLQEHDVSVSEFNSYGARRGHHEVMMRGTFANVRIKNLMIPQKPDGGRVEGGVTLYQPSGEQMPIYDAAMKYVAHGTPTVVFGGEEYGTGSSRDWAAKGTQLLGVKAVVARSFERIHRSNLVGMGVLPLQFKGSDSVQSLGIKGDEQFDIIGLENLKPQHDVTLVIRRNGRLAPGSEGAAADRHADRGGLLHSRRHHALRVARAAREGGIMQVSSTGRESPRSGRASALLQVSRRRAFLQCRRRSARVARPADVASEGELEDLLFFLEDRIVPAARPRKVDRQIENDLRRPPREHQNAVGKKYASRMSWVMKRTVFLVSIQISASAFCIASRVAASRAPKGSSISRTDGFDGERAAQPDTLAHSAGEPVRVVVGEILQAHEIDDVRDALPALLGGNSHRLESEGDIAGDSEPGEKRKLLEYDAAVQSRASHRASIDENRSAARRIQPRDQVQYRRFPASRGADHADEFALADREGDVVEYAQTRAVARTAPCRIMLPEPQDPQLAHCFPFTPAREPCPSGSPSSPLPF